MTNLPIQKVLQKPDVAGRMVRWAVELSEFDIQYEPRGSIKGQVYADFVAELPPGGEQELEAASAVTGGGGVGAGGRIGLATGLEETPALAARASFSAFANIILLEAPITDPTSRQAKQQGLVLEQLCGFTIQEEMRNASNIVQ